MIKEIKYQRCFGRMVDKLKYLPNVTDDKTISLLNNFLSGYEDYIVRDSINEFFKLNNYNIASERDLFIL